MSHPRPVLAFIAIAFACLGLRAVPVHAEAFGQVADVPGYRFHSVLRVSDGQGPGEMMMVHKQDRHYAIFDLASGTLKQDFRQYVEDFDMAFQTFDVTGDGRSELFFMRWSFIGPGSSFAQFRWDGSSYAPVFNLPEPVPGILVGHLRSTSFVDLIEAGPDDVTVRDANTGVAIWRASASIPGWVGTSPRFQLVDIDHDGILEIVIIEVDSAVPSPLTATHVVKYSGGPGGVFTRLWSSPGRFPEAYFNSDVDPQAEFALQDLSSLSGHKTIVDGLTGITVLDLPQLGMEHQIATLDLQGDGPEEIIASRQQPDDLQVYAFGPGGYIQLFASTAAYDEFSVIPFRSTTRLDFYQQAGTDLRILDPDGVVLFTASTSLPGWTGAGLFVVPTDVDHDGRYELLLMEGGRVRCIRYTGAITQTWQADSANFSSVMGNTDGDPQEELMLYDVTGHSYRLVDGLTGAVEGSWPQFKFGEAFARPGAFLPNGPSHVLFFRDPYLGPLPLSTAYLWDGTLYQVQYALPDSAGFGTIEARSATQDELLELIQSPLPGPATFTEVIVRDALDGHMLFQASRTLANWTGLDPDESTGLGVITVHERDTRRIFLNEPWGTRFLQFIPTLGTPRTVLPTALRVLPSAPNPFRTSTSLSFDLPRTETTTVRIFDVLGRLVRRFDRTFPAGRNILHWDGLDDAGRPAPSGVLFYEVQAGGMRQSRKLVRTE